ncbi:ABC transporter ATP-binding protein [Cohnella sp. 56]|uniref:ABC transporter ATP-binding protein n=1 Tax=Cohnella sp. 56 TaxID=3113722 RepID=UPI0030E7BF8A
MEAKGICFGYGKLTQELADVSLRLAPGRVTAIVGPNGSGKSTLLGVLSGHLRPSRGEVLLDDRPLSSYKARALARRLAVVHQINEAPDDLTVERLVGYGRQPYRSALRRSSEDDGEAVDWALSCTGLGDRRDTRLDRLSGGERQRAWIAMALAQRTGILLLDEPTTYLDMYHQIEVLELIRRLNREQGMTIGMVLHDINQAIRYSDDIVVMRSGRVAASGASDETIDPALMRDVYGVEVVVREDAEAGRIVLPLGIAAGS